MASHFSQHSLLESTRAHGDLRNHLQATRDVNTNQKCHISRKQAPIKPSKSKPSIRAKAKAKASPTTAVPKPTTSSEAEVLEPQPHNEHHDNDEDASPFSLPATSKRDKRQIKHSLLLSRLRASADAAAASSRSDRARGNGSTAATGRITKNARKRQRHKRARRLIADMGDLGEALPEIDGKEEVEDDEDGSEWDDMADGEGAIVSDGEGQPQDGDKVMVTRGSPELKAEESASRRARRRRLKQRQQLQQLQNKGVSRKPGYARRVAKVSSLERDRFGRNLAAMGLGFTPSGAPSNDVAPQLKDSAHSAQWSALRAQISQSLATNGT